MAGKGEGRARVKAGIAQARVGGGAAEKGEGEKGESYPDLEGLGAIVGINPQGCHPATVQSVAGSSGGRAFEIGEDGRIRPWYTIQRDPGEC